jgi:phospholipid N-methyltransferase
VKGVKHLPKFLGEFLRHPSTMGAVTPSSVHLAKAITDWVDLSNARYVLEVGPGTGIFTDLIVQRLPPGAQYAAIEINARMAEIFRRRHPSLTLVEDSVANVAEICRRLGFPGIDCIVCGLPWSSFAEAQQTVFLEQIMTVLRPGGQFVTFAYLEGLLLPAGRKFPRLLRRYFPHVSKSHIVWRNLTPAFVYQCRR